MSDLQHIGDLTPDPANARKHTPRNVGAIVDALQEVGAARSIVIDEAGVILAGNATVEAAGEAGITKVRVVDVDGDTIVAVRRSGLTAAQKVRLALFDNRAAELADGWDVDVLRAVQADGVSLEGLWTVEELERLQGSAAEVAGPALPKALQMTPGQEYCVIVCADAAEWEAMRAALGLGLVRRGGYRLGSPFDAVGTQRVIPWAALRERLKAPAATVDARDGA